MKNHSEAVSRLGEARRTWDAVQRLQGTELWPVIVQQAQLCVEHSAKAVIACFEAPVWDHDPAQQFHPLINDHEAAIRHLLGEEMLLRLNEVYGNGLDPTEKTLVSRIKTKAGRAVKERW